MSDTNNKPIREIRMGSIKASIWENKNDKGVWHNVSLSRIYKDGDEWKRSENFGRDDLLTVAKVADLAHTWIYKQGQSGEVR